MTHSDTSEYTFEKISELYKILRSYIEHEDYLINFRSNWMYLIQSFLVASYGFTIQKKLEVMSKIDKPISELPEFLKDTLVQTDRFLNIISIVGIWLVLLEYYQSTLPQAQ
jgi:hypothetical protein